jgi:hypothetical protein
VFKTKNVHVTVRVSIRMSNEWHFFLLEPSESDLGGLKKKFDTQ